MFLSLSSMDHYCAFYNDQFMGCLYSSLFYNLASILKWILLLNLDWSVCGLCSELLNYLMGLLAVYTNRKAMSKHSKYFKKKVQRRIQKPSLKPFCRQFSQPLTFLGAIYHVTAKGIIKTLLCLHRWSGKTAAKSVRHVFQFIASKYGFQRWAFLTAF